VVRALAVSNLQHWGHWTLSPRSAPNDGRLEVQGFNGSPGSLFRLRRLLPAGLHQSSAAVWRTGGRGATVTTPPRWRLSADGVAVGRGAFTVELEPQRATLLI
jgi:diacylglycerol kinase family enzyme